MSRPAEIVLGGAGPTARDFAFWGTAALAAVLVHLAVVAGLYAAVPEDTGQEAFEEAMMIDLAPMPIAAPDSVAPEMLVEDSPEENLEPVEEVVELAKAEPAPILDPVEPLLPDDVAPEAATEAVTEPVAEPVETVAALEPAVEPVEAVDEVAPEPVEQEVLEPEPVERQVVEAEPVEPDPVEVAEIADVEPPELTQEVVEPEIVDSKIVEIITPEVAIPLPQPRPERVAEAAPQPPRRTEPPPRREVARKQAPKQEARPAPKKTRQPAAKPRSEAAASRSAQASTAPKVSPAKWHNAVRAAIVRRVGRMRGMRGTVRVRFVVSDSGSIVSASLAGSSGDGRLDTAAVRMVRQARVPPPPRGVEGGRHAFSVPLTFK